MRKLYDQWQTQGIFELWKMQRPTINYAMIGPKQQALAAHKKSLELISEKDEQIK